MTGVPFVILAVVLSLGLQPPKKDPAPPQPPPKKEVAAIVSVEIVVGLQDALQKICSAGGPPPSSVFVASNSKQVFHCVGNKLLNHADHGKDPNLEKAVVRLGTGQMVRWFSKTNRFFVTAVERHEVPAAPTKKTVAPDFPFTKPFPKEYRNEAVSAPVRDEPGTVVQRYKASFNIEGVGLIDPDLICSM